TEDKNIYIRDITVIPDSYAIKKFGKDIDLTHREFELFLYLARHKSLVMTREHLLETVWGYDYVGDVRTVEVTVSLLREKIEDDPSHPEYIMTRRGVGYYIKGDDEMKQFLKNLQSLQFKLVMIYMLLIIIGMQVIVLYFTKRLERVVTGNFKNNIYSQVSLID